ncbi:MAG: hypothetical protein HFF83_11515 [Oscillibacter sp.]|jgi:hypothetical protein|nr:hypothetical protein [Oscillibacter sp.]
MNGCEDFLELLDSFLDGELPPDQMLRVQAHLDACPACRDYVDGALTLRAAFPSVEDTDVPEGFAENVMERVRASALKPAALHRRRWMSAVAALAACCAIVILLRFGPVGMSGGLSENTARMEDTAESAVCEDTENVTEQDDGEVDDLDATASVESGASYNTDENEEKNAGQTSSQNTSGVEPQLRSAPAEDSQKIQDHSDAGIPSAMSEPAPDENSSEPEASSRETAPAAGLQETAPAAGPEESVGPLMAAVPAPASASAKTGEQVESFPPESRDVGLNDVDLILSQEEAGDLLDSFTLAEDNGSERTYLLTRDEFAGLLELLSIECDVQNDKELITVVVTAA